MTRKKALERWEIKICKAEVTLQAIWSIAKSLLKRDGPRAPTAIHFASGLKFYPFDKANAIAVWKFSSRHMICVTITICIRRSKFRTYMTIQQNYAGNKQKSYKIMIMKMFAILDKAKPDIESIRGLTLAVAKHTTVQVTRLSF
jgi:hypothetical protein